MKGKHWNSPNSVEIDQIEVAMALPQDLGLAMDIDLDHSPLIIDTQNTPSSENFSDELDEAIFNFNILSRGPPSLPSFTQASSDSLSESASQGNPIPTGNDDKSYRSAEEYFLGINDRIPEILDSPTTHHFRPHSYQTRTTSAVETLEGIKPCSSHERTCMALAQRVFASLHTPSTFCLSVYRDPPTEGALSQRKIDSILSVNRQAIQAVSQILDCVCSAGSSMQMVLVSICNKVAAWYRALARNSLQRSPASDNNGLFTSPPMAIQAIDNNKISLNNNDEYENDMKSDDYSSHVIYQPLSMGSYTFDIALESKLRVQVVQSELQNLEQIINRLCSHMTETKRGSYIASPTTQTTVTSTTRARNLNSGRSQNQELNQESHPFAEKTKKSLATFLNWQLQSVKTDIAAVQDSTQ